jgi:hypothetical protein
MAKRDDHWFKFYYRHFIIATANWPDDKVGAYIKLLIHQFDRHGLPDDEEELKTMITSFKKNWPALSKKFNKGEDGLLRNDFMNEIREERDKKSVKGFETGSLGGRPKKKPEGLEKKPKGFKNETHIDNISLSYSNSPSVSDQEEEGTGEETHGLSTSGFWVNEFDKDYQLSDIQIGGAIQFVTLTTLVVLTDSEVVDAWEAFKINNFSQRKWYNSFEELLKHFRNSLKTEKQKNGTRQQSVEAGGNKVKPGTSEARIERAKNW